MDKFAFLEALDRELAKLVPYQERMNILRYYEEYFDEAGPEGEAGVIEELGDPRALARRLAAEGGYERPAQNEEPPAPGPAPRRGRGVILAAVIALVVVLLLTAAAVVMWMVIPAVGHIWESPAGPSSDMTAAPEDSVHPQSSSAPVNSPTSDSGDGWSSSQGEAFTEVHIEVSVADVTIAEGDDYSVYLEWGSSGGYYLSYTLDQGKLKVTSPKHSDGGSVNAKATVTVPQGVTLGEIEVKTGLGGIHVENVSADEVICESGLGGIDLTGVTAYVAKGETGLGEVTWEGALSQETVLNSGMGSITVSAADAASEWSYELNCGGGKVVVDGVDQGHNARQRGSGSGRLEASSGMGGVTVEFDG